MIPKIVLKKAAAERLVGGENLDAFLTKIYLNRGITNVNELDYRLENLSHFSAFSQMPKALERIYQNIIKNEHIVIVGDFDVDGATSVAILVKALALFNFRNVSYIVPDRFQDGYGLSDKIIERISGTNLIITVDNGISSLAAIELAKKKGIDVIVTDHHEPPKVLPQAWAILDPKVEKISSLENLAGVGVCFYLVMALRRFLKEKNWFAKEEKIPNIADLLDLVALGTIADVVPMDYNNRILVANGLKRLKKNNSSVNLFLNQSSPFLDYTDIAFKVAPKLNAAGRLANMTCGVSFLLETDYPKMLAKKEGLETLNGQRKAIENRMLLEAQAALPKKVDNAICFFNPNWHLGVIGILAAKLVDSLEVPVIVFTRSATGILKGSGRSVPEINLKEVLDAIAEKEPDIFLSYGGHKSAAGISLKEENYAVFCKLFAQSTPPKKQDRIYEIDMEPTSSDLVLETAIKLKNVAVFGEKFPKPIFGGYFTIIDKQIVGGKHLKLKMFLANTTKEFSGIFFNVPKNIIQMSQLKAQVYIIYELDINEFLGKEWQIILNILNIFDNIQRLF